MNRQRGSALLVVVIIVGLLAAFALVNSRTLAILGHEMRLVEQRQVQQ